MLAAIKNYPYAVIAAVMAIALILFIVFSAPRQALSQSGVAISGYAWSDNIGWIDLNCVNSGVCGSNPFGFSIDTNGNITGYAWSDNIGWISANPSDLVGCPSGPCTATLSTSTGAMSGWIKAIGADNKGWDGWISLSGSGYGPTLSGGAISGYGWGSDVVGWLKFSANTTYNQCTAAYTCTGTGSQTITYTNTSCQQSTVTTCVSPNFCSTGSSTCLVPAPTFTSFTPTGTTTVVETGQLQVSPLVLSAGETSRVYWDVSNVQSCTVTGTNGDHWTGTFSGYAGEQTSAIAAQTTYTLSCTAYSGAAPPSITSAQTINITPVFHEK